MSYFTKNTKGCEKGCVLITTQYLTLANWLVRELSIAIFTGVKAFL